PNSACGVSTAPHPAFGTINPSCFWGQQPNLILGSAANPDFGLPILILGSAANPDFEVSSPSCFWDQPSCFWDHQPILLLGPAAHPDFGTINPSCFWDQQPILIFGPAASLLLGSATHPVFGTINPSCFWGPQPILILRPANPDFETSWFLGPTILLLGSAPHPAFGTINHLIFHLHRPGEDLSRLETREERSTTLCSPALGATPGGIWASKYLHHPVLEESGFPLSPQGGLGDTKMPSLGTPEPQREGKSRMGNSSGKGEESQGELGLLLPHSQPGFPWICRALEWEQPPHTAPNSACGVSTAPNSACGVSTAPNSACGVSTAPHPAFGTSSPSCFWDQQPILFLGPTILLLGPSTHPAFGISLLLGPAAHPDFGTINPSCFWGQQSSLLWDQQPILFLGPSTHPAFGISLFLGPLTHPVFGTINPSCFWDQPVFGTINPSCTPSCFWDHQPILLLGTSAHPAFGVSSPSCLWAHQPILPLGPSTHPAFGPINPSWFWAHQPILVLGPSTHPVFGTINPSCFWAHQPILVLGPLTHPVFGVSSPSCFWDQHPILVLGPLTHPVFGTINPSCFWGQQPSPGEGSALPTPTAPNSPKGDPGRFQCQGKLGMATEGFGACWIEFGVGGTMEGLGQVLGAQGISAPFHQLRSEIPRTRLSLSQNPLSHGHGLRLHRDDPDLEPGACKAFPFGFVSLGRGSRGAMPAVPSPGASSEPPSPLPRGQRSKHDLFHFPSARHNKKLSVRVRGSSANSHLLGTAGATPAAPLAASQSPGPPSQAGLQV
ncbi:hypothetical protein DV515_00017591, partial [Chloebia gouldiae]